MTQIKYLSQINNSSDIENIFKPGVYKMFHQVSPDLIYVGSTYATGKKRNMCGVYRRMLQHIYKLIKVKHASKILQRIVNEHGIDGLRFEIIELCEKADCRTREQFYLDTLAPQLNRSKSSIGCHGVKHSAATKALKSIKSKGRALPQSVYEKLRRPVYQYDDSGNYIRQFNSMAEASKELKIDRGSINNCALGNVYRAGGYLWTFGEPPILKTRKRAIMKYDLSMNFIKEYNTLAEIQAEYNLTSSSAIRNCFSGVQKQAYGFIWKEIRNPDELKLSYKRLDKVA